MSRDFLSTQIRTGNIIGGNLTTGQPNLIIYSKDHATNKEGGKNSNLSSFLSNSDNFPANTLAIFYGSPTTDNTTAVISNPGNYSSVFASDIVVQGTMFVNVLRDINGNLIDFSGGSYISSYTQNGIDLTTAISAESADEILAEKIYSNTSLINNLTINSIENIAVNESIEDDILLYWDKNNNKYETKSSSALSSLPSIKLHSDIITDTILTNNPFTGLAENYNTTLSSELGNRFALLWSTDQEKFIPGEIVLSSVTDSIQTNIDAIELNITSIQNLLNTHESSIGLNNDGTYLPPSGSNYIDSAVSVRNEIILLDTQVGTNTSNITTNITNISTNTNSISDLQDELTATQLGSGLDQNGTYTADNTTNYIDNATSLKNADSLLDTQIKSNTDNISTNTTNISDLQDELDATQLGSGLNQDGTYAADNTTNYISNATSLKNADVLLDTQIKSNTDDIETLDGRVDNAFTSIITNAANIATNAQNIAAIQQGAQNQAEVDQIETSLGLDSDGSLIEYTSTNFISNAVDQEPQDTYFDAINKLDTAISSRSIFNIQGIDHTNKADGRILQYNFDNDEFVYVDPQAGLSGQDGASILFKGQVNQIPSGTGDVTLIDGTTTFTPEIANAVILNPAGNIYFYNGNDWIDGGSIKGSDGLDGTNGINGIDGADGADGTSVTVQSVTNNGNGTLTITFSDGTVHTTEDLTGPAGADGAPGADGINGIDGADGTSVTVQSVTNNGNGTLTITFSDGTVHTTEDLTGPIGPAGADGVNGADGADGTSVTIQSVTNNGNGTLTITFSDGTVHTTEDLTGPAGADGTSVTVQSVTNNGNGTLTITFSDGTVHTTEDLTGPIGPAGADGVNGVDGADGTSVTVQSVTNNGNGTLTITFSDGTVHTTEDLTGPIGPIGPAGADGINGADGADGTSVTVQSVTNNGNGTLTITFSDGTVHTTEDLTGPAGADGVNGTDGADGTSVTVQSVTNNGNGTLTITFSDGTVHTTEDLTGPIGPAGADGADGTSVTVQSVTNNGNGTLTITFSDGTVHTTEDLTGPTGPQGIQGIQGEQGIQGPQGLQGPQGDQGPAGSGITFKGSVATINDLPEIADTGDAYIIQSDDSLHIYDGLEFISGGSIQGPQGVQGEQGIQGPQGEQGIQGPQGLQGIQGEQGPAGNDGSSAPTISTVSITGTTVTTSFNEVGVDDVIGVFEFNASTSSLWEISDDGTELYPHGIIDGTLDTGMFAINLSAGAIDYSSQDISLFDILEELSSMNSYTLSARDSNVINDTYFEFDLDGNIMPKA